MTKTIGVLELASAVGAAFDDEFQHQYKIRYMPAAKWSGKKIGYLSARAMGPFLGAVQTRLRKKFDPHADKLILNPSANELSNLYSQPVQQTVVFVTGELMKVLSANTNAKII